MFSLSVWVTLKWYMSLSLDIDGVWYIHIFGEIHHDQADPLIIITWITYPENSSATGKTVTPSKYTTRCEPVWITISLRKQLGCNNLFMSNRFDVPHRVVGIWLNWNRISTKDQTSIFLTLSLVNSSSNGGLENYVKRKLPLWLV